MTVCVENCCDAGKAQGHPYAAYQEQSLSSQLVDKGHAKEGCDQIHCTDENRLQRPGDLAESRGCKDVIRIVKNCVDPGELVEHSNGDSQKDRQPVVAFK